MGAVETLTNERLDIAKALKALADQAVAENGGVFDAAQLDRVEALKTQFVEKGTEIDRAKSLVATQEEVDAFLSLDQAENLNGEALKGATQGLRGPRKSIGSVFTGSKGYKGLLDRYPNGIGDSTKGINSGPVQIGALKALLTGTDHDTSAGALVRPDYIGTVGIPTTPLSLRQLITVGNTSSDKIEFAQVLPWGNGSTNNAAGVLEATTDAPVGSGNPAVTPAQAGVKPQSEIKFRKKSVDVITVAHWVAATKRSLSDAGQLRTLIDGFLRDGIARKVEELIINGDSENPTLPDTDEWDGILNTEGTQDVAFDTDIVTTARKIITRVNGVGGQVTAFAVSPAVAEEIDLTRDSTGRFYGNGPFSLGPNTLWGRPRVEVYGLPDDVIIGGDWRTAVLWDRESTTVTATDAHLDFFTRNLVAILAEARAAFGVLNPQLLAIGQTEAA